MRLVTFEVATPIGGVRRIGALRREDTEVVDLNAGQRWLREQAGSSTPARDADWLVPAEMIELLRRAEPGMAAASAVLGDLGGLAPQTLDGATVVYRREEVRLLSPVPRPLSIREHSEWDEHMSKRFPDQAKPRRWYTFPANLYNGNPLSVDGPEDPLYWPDYSEQYDLEPELGFFVGKTGTNLSREEAQGYIAGYTLFIDPSARDDHVRGRPGVPSHKGKDFQNIIGPCLVTPDEFDEWHGRAWITVNGELWWEYDIGHRRRFSAADLVAFASDGETVEPGDFFGIGTIGTGAAVDLGRWVKPGDVFEFGIEGLGVLRHTVVRRPGATWVRDGIPGNKAVPASPVAAGP
jgi:2-keto-4-pentenoate hydratase/2-oxohepta-3-ene-1,7-dioic acid hydratase in catechol pathway